MIFGRKNQQQAPSAPPAGSGAGMNQGQNVPWAGAGGYPTQPSGTGYAGYAPGQAGSYGTQGGYASGAQPYAAAGQPVQPYGTAGQSVSPYGTAGQPVQPYASAGQSVSPVSPYGTAGQSASPYGTAGQSASPYGTAGQSASPYAPAGQPVQPYGPAGQSASPYAPAGQSASPYGTVSGLSQPYGAGGGGTAQPAGGYGTAGYGQPQGYGRAPQNGQGGYVYPGAASGAYGAGTSGQPAQGGYSPYAQMGRNQQPVQGGFSQQIPLNGGGYVPPAVPVKKLPFVFKNWMLVALGGVLVLLFAAGMFIPAAKPLSWVFIVLAAASVAFFWVRPVISGNRRLCYTIIFAVLTAVALLNVLGVLQPRKDAVTQPAAAGTQSSGGTGASSSGLQGGGTAPETVMAAAPAVTSTPAPEDTSTVDRLDSFFRYWAANRQDEMLTLCSPSWQSGVDNPRTALFGLLANRTPLDYEVEKTSGTSEDTSRTVTLTSTMDRNNGKDPVKYRLNVLMVREGDQWYVDPQSLKTYEEAETPDPALAATATPSPEPAVRSDTILYYNPDGGTKYHLDQNCKSTHAKFLPFKGHFTYAEVNDDKYKNLSPCNVCAAPLRP